MQSVSSSAVAQALGTWETIATDNSTYSLKGIETRNGKYLSLHLQNYYFSYGQQITNVPIKWRPRTITRFYSLVYDIGSSVYKAGWINLEPSGGVYVYGISTSGHGYGYTDTLVMLFEDF